MPLITEHGFVFGQDNRAVIKELTHEPTPDWIREFGTQYENPPIVENGPLVPSQLGKFVAIRNLILLTPYPELIKHQQIVESRSDSDDLGDRIAEELERARHEKQRILTSNYSQRPIRGSNTSHPKSTFSRGRDIGERIAEELELAKQRAGSKPLHVTDAGYFKITSHDGEANSVVLTGQSEDFGKSDDATRRRSVGLLRASLMDIGVSYEY